MNWAPEPYPSMRQDEYDDLARQVRRAGYTWPEAWGPLVVDDEHNLIDGFKRQKVAHDLGVTNCPAYVLTSASVPEDERSEKYTTLRAALNHHAILVDEIEGWLREVREP